MNPEILERLEIRLTWLEQANQEMSDEIFRQQREIETLRLGLGKLHGKLESALADAAGEHPPFDPQAERPPHY